METNNGNSEIKHIVAHGAKHYGPSKQKGNDEARLKFFLILMSFWAFAGEEGIKIIFRKNFGFNAVSIIKLLMFSILLLLTSSWLFYEAFYPDSYALESGTSDTHFVGGFIYIFLAVLVIYKGITGRILARKKSDFSDYSGDNTFLQFLKKEKWRQENIQLIAEPLVVLTIGILITIYDPIVGIPLIFCAASVWITLIARKIFFRESMHEKVEELNRKENVESTNEVNY